ncbi:MAG TPA: histidinol-phosphatase, partial [Calditrichae bacterium]|nr:histidinol-phosphatase [Calditrichia bacterium]
KYAKEKGVKLSIGPDAHRTEGLLDVVYGLHIARKGWQEKEDILNCLSADELRAFARRRR